MTDSDDPISFVLQTGPNQLELQALIRRIRHWVLVKLGDAQSALAALGARVDALEATPAITMTVVGAVGALPASAGSRQFFRVQGDPAVYIGNGAGQPLSKLVPV